MTSFCETCAFQRRRTWNGEIKRYCYMRPVYSSRHINHGVSTQRFSVCTKCFTLLLFLLFERSFSFLALASVVPGWTKAKLLWQWKPVGFASSGGGDGLSGLTWLSVVCWVRDQGRGLRWAQGRNHGWVLRSGKCFSFSLKKCNRWWTLFGLAASFLTGCGAISHFSSDPIVLRCFTLASTNHLTGCCPKPVLKPKT